MDGKKLIPSLKMPFDAILEANKTKDWLPSPEIISKACDSVVNKATNNIIMAFEDVVQVELIKTRWEEIKKLQQMVVAT